MRLRLQDQYCCRLERSPSLRHGLCAMRSSVLTWCRVVPVRRYGGGFCEFKRERKMLFQPSREGMLFSSRGAPLHRALHRYLQRVCGTEQPRLRQSASAAEQTRIIEHVITADKTDGGAGLRPEVRCRALCLKLRADCAVMDWHSSVATGAGEHKADGPASE